METPTPRAREAREISRTEASAQLPWSCAKHSGARERSMPVSVELQARRDFSYD